MHTNVCRPPTESLGAAFSLRGGSRHPSCVALLSMMLLLMVHVSKY